jgi:FkbM family methyltransferase
MAIRANFMNAMRRIYLATPWRAVRRLYFKLFCDLVRGRKTRASVDGIVYELDLSEMIDVCVLLGRYEADMAAGIEKYGRSGMTALDIGANIGAHTFRLARRVGAAGRVYAFEPTDYAFQKLIRNLELNTFNNVVPYKLALSVDNLRAQRIRYRSSWPTNGVQRETESVVDFQRLDDVLKEARSAPISLIKLDVDGNEHSVLRGGEETLRRDQPIILLEVWGPNFANDNTNPFIWLKARGYRFYDIQTEAEFPSVEVLRERVSANGKLLDYSFNIVAKMRDL